MASQRWTKHEDETVRTHSVPECVKLLPSRTRQAIICRRGTLGVAPDKARWTEAEMELLRSCKRKKLNSIVKLFPGRTRTAIERQRGVLGHAKKANPDWTNRQVEALVRLYPEGSREELKSATKRSWEAIRSRARHMGLTRKRKPRDTSHETLRQALRNRAREDGISLRGLARNVGVWPWKFRESGWRKLRLDEFEKCIAFFGGRILIDWQDD